MKNKLSAPTELIHNSYAPPAGFRAVQPGIYKASTVIFSSVEQMRQRNWESRQGYTYGLHGTPTTFTLEARLCMLEGGKQCILLPSGLAAIANVALALLKSGDEVLIPDNAYGPSKDLANNELAAWGIKCQLYNPLNPADLAARITPATRLVWLEAPGSVTMEFPDMHALTRICRKHAILCALDNTWGAGIAFAPFDLLNDGGSLGVDISVHALTKYPSGGGDVLMGSIITQDEALHLRLKATHMRLGFGVGANDAEAVLRALPSLFLRYKAQDRTARALAQWLDARPEISAVLHPAMPCSPGHDHWQALCGSRNAAAGLFSVVFNEPYTSAQIDSFCNALQLFKIGYSWGGPVSLAMPYAIHAMRTAEVTHWPHAGILVRLAVGLEDEADLRADIENALQQLS